MGTAGALVLGGCSIHGLSFVQDRRLDFVAPDANSEVELPFTLDWSMRDFEDDFAVFFDQSPMPSNESLLWLVPGDDPCRIEPDCPDAEWLADHDIYITNASELAVDFLPDLRDNNRDSDRHDVTIILLDESGRRMGESAFIREFVVVRPD
jgi:hypothetical protein